MWMNEETLKNLSREEAINYLDNEMDYTYQLRNKIDKAIEYMKNYIEVEERKYNDNVMKEFEFVIKLLKN